MSSCLGAVMAEAHKHLIKKYYAPGDVRLQSIFVVFAVLEANSDDILGILRVLKAL